MKRKNQESKKLKLNGETLRVITDFENVKALGGRDITYRTPQNCIEE